MTKQTEKKKDEPGQNSTVNICPKHGIDMEYIREIVPTSSTDADGNETFIDQEVQYYICYYCDHQIDYVAEGGEQAEILLSEQITKYKESNPVFTPHRINGDLIKELMDFHRDTDADENPKKSMALFQISSALTNCVSANAKGKIHPNLGFWWSEPSGTNKTPLLISGVDDFADTVYKEHILYETGTAKGMHKSLAKLYEENPHKKRNILIRWDEGQNITTMMKENALADIYSFFCQAIDNRLQSYITIARGDEKSPPITANIWISGVPEMIENAVKSFWFQGAGNRFLFVKSKQVWIKDIRRATLDELEQNKVKEHLIEELNLLKNIKWVEYSDDFLIAYNTYRREILEPITKVQSDLSASQDIDNYSILSKIKYPVLVWKLAIIHAASRGNFSGELLQMDVEDLVEAKKDLEEYHANVMEVFNYWLERATKDADIRSSQRIKKKFERHIRSILRNKDKRWSVAWKDAKKKNGEDISGRVAFKSDYGTWVIHSDLMPYANMMSDDFSKAVNTLKEQGHLIVKEGVRHLRDGSQDVPLDAAVPVSTFYKWKQEPSSPSQNSNS